MEPVMDILQIITDTIAFFVVFLLGCLLVTIATNFLQTGELRIERGNVFYALVLSLAASFEFYPLKSGQLYFLPLAIVTLFFTLDYLAKKKLIKFPELQQRDERIKIISEKSMALAAKVLILFLLIISSPMIPGLLHHDFFLLEQFVAIGIAIFAAAYLVAFAYYKGKKIQGR